MKKKLIRIAVVVLLIVPPIIVETQKVASAAACGQKGCMFCCSYAGKLACSNQCK